MDFWKELADLCALIAERRALALWLVRDGDRRSHHHPRLSIYAAIDRARAFGAGE